MAEEVWLACAHPIGYRPVSNPHPIRTSVLSNVSSPLDFNVSDLLWGPDMMTDGDRFSCCSVLRNRGLRRP